MKYTFFAAFILLAIAVNFAAPQPAVAESTANYRVAKIVSLLPASDAVVTMESGRFFGEALPTLLSGNQLLLGKITAELAKIQTATGIDLKQFETVAAGFTVLQISPKKFDFDPVVLARGQINSAALISLAKIAANGKYREERIGRRTVYVFSVGEAVRQNVASSPSSFKKTAARRLAQSLSEEIAVTAYDPNTVALGSLARVRELLGTKPRVSAELAGYLGRTDGSVIDFAAKLPNGMSGLLPLDNDELGRNIDAIRVLYGSISVAGDATSVNAVAKTVLPEQAASLKSTLDGLQMLGKAFLGSAKGDDKQVLARIIENAKFGVTRNEVSVNLQIPQSDLNVLIGRIK